LNVISIGNRLQIHGNRLHLWKTIFRNIWATGNWLLPSCNRLPETKMLCKFFVKIETHLANQLCFSKTFLRVYLNSYLEIFTFAWHLAFFIPEIYLEWSLKFLGIIKIILEASLLQFLFVHSLIPSSPFLLEIMPNFSEIYFLISKPYFSPPLETSKSQSAWMNFFLFIQITNDAILSCKGIG